MLTNIARNAARMSIAANQRRMQSNVSTTFLTASKKTSVKKDWFSDPATYPLIAVLGAACALCTGVGFACLGFNPDVQIDPKKRNQVIRSWGLNH
mmetsp:Transcript_23538/g.32872  ORF Transcript_23538/g.32872 Transcript_23538/m.32872 type:complete len:95 (-) Transcript_23538:159-443(-)